MQRLSPDLHNHPPEGETLSFSLQRSKCGPREVPTLTEAAQLMRVKVKIAALCPSKPAPAASPGLPGAPGRSGSGSGRES